MQVNTALLLVVRKLRKWCATFRRFWAVVEVMQTTSTHLEYVSTSTSNYWGLLYVKPRWIFCQRHDGRPQDVTGRHGATFWVNWQAGHSLTVRSMSSVCFGYQTWLRTSVFIRVPSWCPSCKSSHTECCRELGMTTRFPKWCSRFQAIVHDVSQNMAIAHHRLLLQVIHFPSTTVPWTVLSLLVSRRILSANKGNSCIAEKNWM